jgi:hypothetical protein
MKIALLNIYTQNIKELSIITVEYNKRKYCEKHGYEHIIAKDNFAFKHLGFEKLDFIKKTLQTGKYDWVFWCGSDTMITNYDIKLEHLIGDTNDPYCMIIAPDVWDWNSDSMLFKNDPKTIAFLELIISRYDKYVDADGNPYSNNAYLKDGCVVAWGEQAALIEECKGKFFSPELKPEYKDFVKEVPQKMMNSYLYSLYPTQFHAQKKDYVGRNGEWSDGDFLIHWPGIRNDARLKLALNVIQFIKE